MVGPANLNMKIISKMVIIELFILLNLDVKSMQKTSFDSLDIGYSVAIKKVSLENMRYAKSVGISYIETSLAEFIDKQAKIFLFSDKEIIKQLKVAKSAADKAGIKIWSIHMPFSDKIDLSLTNETERKEVIAFHKRLIQFCAVLKPEVILFHPSYFLGRNERDLRKNQMIKSAIQLNPYIQKIGATMVIENMLGKDLVTADGKREWPLCRDVAETKEIMFKLPESIHSAIDFNHIKNPEDLILAMGKRLKTIHVADGDGIKERHYFPCSGQGMNDWNAILAALDKVNYTGPFLYECHFEDAAELMTCYKKLYSSYRTQQ